MIAGIREQQVSVGKDIAQARGAVGKDVVLHCGCG